MKVMGSATLLFEAIVIALTIPVAISIYDVPKNLTLVVALSLTLICILAIGAVRRDRKTAVIAGSVVQLLVLLSAIFVPPMLFPGIVFGSIWALSVKLSEKLPA